MVHRAVRVVHAFDGVVVHTGAAAGHAGGIQAKEQLRRHAAHQQEFFDGGRRAIPRRVAGRKGRIVIGLGALGARGAVRVDPIEDGIGNRVGHARQRHQHLFRAVGDRLIGLEDRAQIDSRIRLPGRNGFPPGPGFPAGVPTSVNRPRSHPGWKTGPRRESVTAWKTIPRINLCTILKADQAVTDGAKKMLMALPGMTDAIADAILDWIDADSTPRPQGAEADYYAALTPGYAPRNGPPATIEELLLVRGVTPQLLFGLDAAGMAGGGAGVDNNAIEGVDNSDGSMNHGWAAYLTVYSRESTLRADGTPKINLNGTDLKKLYDALQKALGAEWATFIVAYRQGGSQGSSSGATAAALAGQLDFSQKATATIASVLDLVGVKTSAKFQGAKTKTVLNSPFSENQTAMATYLPKLLDNTTVSAETTILGRININQASWVVLQGIPGMTVDLANQIIAKRTLDPTVAGPAHRYETWILTEGIVPLATMKTMMPFVNAGGSVYRVQSIGHFEEGGGNAHLEVLLDASKRPTNVLLWRDVSHLSLGCFSEAFAPQASVAEKN